MALVITACALGVVVLLWLNGRYWRSRWTCVSNVTKHSRVGTENGSKTLAVLWTGAFNTADVHYERLIDLFQQVGDVYVVNYAEKRFDSALSDLLLRGYVANSRQQYEEFLLVGASLGGEQELRFLKWLYNNVRAIGYYPTVKLIGCGVPLGGQHLPYPRAVLWLVKHLRIGPLWNFLLGWLPRLAFKPLEKSEMNGVDPDQLNRHMQALWSVKPSAMAEQVAAMVKQPPFEDLPQVPAVYLDCEKEDVIKGPEAREGWKMLMGKSLLLIKKVCGGHVQFVERHNDWRWAFATALRKLGYKVK